MTPLEGHMVGASKPLTVYMNQERSRRRVRDGGADSLREPSRSEFMI